MEVSMEQTNGQNMDVTVTLTMKKLQTAHGWAKVTLLIESTIFAGNSGGDISAFHETSLLAPPKWHMTGVLTVMVR